MITDKKDLNQQNLDQELRKIAKKLEVGDLEQAMLFPKYFQLETTQVCNAKCPFCPSSEWGNDRAVMSDELFEKIVSEMEAHADYIGFVDLQRANEPLTDKKLHEKVRRLKEAKIKKVMFSTNASLMNEERAVQLLEAGLDEVLFSIDSIDKKEYEEMRVGLNFEKVRDNILGFFALRDRINPKMTIRVRGVSFYDLANPDHMQKLLAWENFFKQYAKPHDRIYMKRAHNWGNQKTWEGKSMEYTDVFHPCILPWSTMHISAEGKVSVCPNDYETEKLYIGNLQSETINQVWNGEQITRIRNLHATGNRNELEICRKCILFDTEFSLEDEGKFGDLDPVADK